MFINDYIEKITLQEELENVKEQLKTVQDENAKLKTTIKRGYTACMESKRILLDKNELIAALTAEVHKLKGKKNGTESLKEDEGFDDDQINISDEDFLKYRLSNREGKIKELKAKIEMLENDRKENLVVCADCSHDQQYRIKQLEDELSKSNAEKQELKAKIEMLSRDADKIFKEKRQEGDNLRNRIKDIKARDLNSTISTLIEQASKSEEENQELKKKVQELNDFIQRI